MFSGPEGRWDFANGDGLMYVGPKTTAGIVLVAVAVLAGFGAVWLRSRKSHVDHIVPEVEGAGLTFIASRIPRFWSSVRSRKYIFG